MSKQEAAPRTKITRAKTGRGRRILEKRAPKLIEDAKRALVLYGNKTGQVIKDVLQDLSKLKGVDCCKYTKNNAEVKPFEPGGEAALERHAGKNNCSLFALGTHTKKRPHNLVLGRMYGGHLYDAIELGVDLHEAIHDFGAAGKAAGGFKPAIIFAGEKFESVPNMKMAKSMLLDYFRGLQVEQLNLAGVDRVMMAVALDDTHLLLRQYSIKLKKSGVRVPRVALEEMGPRMNLTVRRIREPPVDMEKEATKQPKLGKKKEKNVGMDTIAGKVGRIYMPKQDVNKLGLSKMKGLKRERRQVASDRADAKKQRVAPAATAAVEED